MLLKPDIKGNELASRIRKTRPETKILYVSGYAEEAFARGGVLEAGTSHLQKPVSADVFTKKVREVLDA